MFALYRLLEVERQHDHLAVGAVEAVAEDALVDIGELVDMLLVEGVAETVAELQLGDELEEGEVEVATHAYLEHGVETVEMDVVLVLAREVDHRTDTADEVGTVVVEALGRELQVDRHSKVGVFQVLRRLARLAAVVEVIEVAEDEVLAAEMECRQNAQRQVLAEAQVGEHADAESGVPGVYLADDGALGAVVEELGPHVVDLHVLHVEAYGYAEVQGAQVDVRLVLHLASLGRGREYGCEHQENDDNSFAHVLVIT